jgi:uncharacterized membrane protein
MRAIIEYRNGLKVFGHPLHTILIHFPLTFWFLVFPLEAFGWWKNSETLWRLAFLANAAGLIASLPVAATGLADLLPLPRDSKVFSKGIFHMLVMLSAASLFAIELFLRGGADRPDGFQVYASLALSFIGTLVLAFGSWLGGELVFGKDTVRIEPEEKGAPFSRPRPRHP